MLDFESQKKLLDPILKNPKNHMCADCDSIAPTWASLDFGVFLCGNCSGAHRALGPTITRVRSANLDKWQSQWLNNMRIGNSELNNFWESDPRASDRKPKTGATLNEIGRYVFQKYVKRKFVKESLTTDPLTLYKNGEYSISNSNSQAKPQVVPKVVSQPVAIQKPSAPISNTPKPAPKADFNLLDFDAPAPVQQNQPSFPLATEVVVQEDFRTNIEEPSTNLVDQLEKERENDFISFDTLVSQQKGTQVPVQTSHQTFDSIRAQNIQLHHPYNAHLGQHNLVYQGHYQQQGHFGYGSVSHPFGHVQHGYGPQIMAQNGNAGYGQGQSLNPQFWI